MKNEKGITIVELLAAVVIAGIIIVPLLTIMTGSFTRTMSQEKETKIAYVAQEVMEKIRLHASDIELPANYSIINGKRQMTYCLQASDPIYSQKGEACIEGLPTDYQTSTFSSSDQYFITVHFIEYDPINYQDFYEVTVTVFEDTKVVIGGENSTVKDKENSVELVTVVEL